MLEEKYVFILIYAEMHIQQNQQNPISIHKKTFQKLGEGNFLNL